jgi:CO/xanthine dehydrogenase FAD-binding subunit
MKSFLYFEPATLDEAFDLLHRFGEKGKFLAGGTDLFIQMKQGKVFPQSVISLNQIQQLNFIEADSEIGKGSRTFPSPRKRFWKDGGRGRSEEKG